MPPIEYAVGYGQSMPTVTSLLPIRPLPLLTTQVWAGVDGCVWIVTLYGLPVATGAVNWYGPVWAPTPITSTPLFTQPDHVGVAHARQVDADEVVVADDPHARDVGARDRAGAAGQDAGLRRAGRLGQDPEPVGGAGDGAGGRGVEDEAAVGGDGECRRQADVVGVVFEPAGRCRPGPRRCRRRRRRWRTGSSRRRWRRRCRSRCRCRWRRCRSGSARSAAPRRSPRRRCRRPPAWRRRRCRRHRRAGRRRRCCAAVAPS